MYTIEGISEEEMQGVLTVREAAKLKKVTRQSIYLAIRLNRLKAYRDGKNWLIFLGDIKKYNETLFSRKYSRHEGELVYDEARGYYSVKSVSKMTGMSVQNLYYAIRKGDLRATRRGKAWVIELRDIFDFQEYLKNPSKHKKVFTPNFL
jgi:excisionase family DNA binding protein